MKYQTQHTIKIMVDPTSIQTNSQEEEDQLKMEEMKMKTKLDLDLELKHLEKISTCHSNSISISWHQTSKLKYIGKMALKYLKSRCKIAITQGKLQEGLDQQLLVLAMAW